MKHEFEFDGHSEYTIRSVEYDVATDAYYEASYTLNCDAMTLLYDDRVFLLDDVKQEDLTTHFAVYQWLYQALMTEMEPSAATEVIQYAKDHIDEAVLGGDTLRWPNGLQLELSTSLLDTLKVDIRYSRNDAGVFYDSIEPDAGGTVEAALSALFPTRFGYLTADETVRKRRALDKLIPIREEALNELKKQRAELGGYHRSLLVVP